MVYVRDIPSIGAGLIETENSLIVFREGRTNAGPNGLERTISIASVPGVT